MRWLKSIAALVALIALALGLPALLLAFIGNPWPAETAWTSPLSDQALIKFVSMAVWVLWAQTLWCVIAEVRAVARARSTTPAPGTFGIQQQLARVLVGAVVAAVIAAPYLPVSPLAAAPQPRTHPTTATTTSTSEPRVPASQPTPTLVPTDTKTMTITVQRGDSLWSIAAEHLDGGERWSEIGRANEGRTMSDGRTFHAAEVIRPGWQLIVPATGIHATPSTGDGRADYTVKAGDTLSQIALDTLGDAHAWPQVFEASERLDQPVPMSDPNLIYPGQLIDIPGEDTPDANSSKPEPEASLPAKSPRAVEAATSEPRIVPHSPNSEAQTQTANVLDDEAADTALPSWVMPGLAGAGTLLAGALMLALRRRRASQYRSRRPGRVITAPAPTVAAVEKSVTVAGSTTTNVVELVDDVLRRLAGTIAATGEPMPALETIEITPASVALHLREPAKPPAPWAASEDSQVWTMDRNVDPVSIGPEPGDRPAPWPLLVTIGHDNDDLWFLNLEDLTFAISGDQSAADDFARFVAAEIACNPWSRHTHLDVVGIAAEVAPMSPDRIHVHELTPAPAATAVAEAVHTIDRLADFDTDTVTARARNDDPDPWPSQLLIIGHQSGREAELDQLTALIDNHPGRTGTAVLLCGDAPSGAFEININEARQLTIPSMNLAARAVGLTVDETQGCASLLAQSMIIEDAPIPDFSDDDGWHELATAAGSLRDQYRVSRGVETIDPSTSLLDEADIAYISVAATTAEDLEALAPKVTERVRNRVEDADPDLDADLDDWFSDHCSRPRLTLMGPVGVRTTGIALDRRKPYYTELFAYLATRPHGATTDEVADAFDITPSRVRTDVNKLRDWLGTNTATGELFLPDARNAPAAQARGIGVYQVIDPLVDVDLFLRLRLRGESRGADGIDDLVQASQLVQGRAFDKLRPGGWGWLLEGDRLDLHMVCAIADVAHVVVTHSLHAGKLDQARTAAGIAITAAPDEEVSRLDLAAVLQAQGHEHEAARILHEDVFNRSEDGEPPVDLTTRCEEIISHRALPRKQAI